MTGHNISFSGKIRKIIPKLSLLPFLSGTLGDLSVCVNAGIFLGLCSAIGRAPDSQVKGPGFDTRSGNILSFLLRFFKKGSCQLLAKVCARSTG